MNTEPSFEKRTLKSLHNGQHGNRVLWSLYKPGYLTYKFSRLISDTFSKEFVKRICINQRIFPWVIILSILITFSLDYVLLFLGEELMGSTLRAEATFLLCELSCEK